MADKLERTGSKSSRLAMALLYIALASVFVSLGKITGLEWQNSTQWALLFYTGSESIRHVAIALRDKKPQNDVTSS